MMERLPGVGVLVSERQAPEFGISIDPSHPTLRFDVSQTLLTRPTTELEREAVLPLAQDRAARRFATWKTNPSQRPTFSLHSSTHGPIATALACPDLFLLDTPLGQERLAAILALVDGARAAGQRLAILTGNPENANAIILALPADGVGRAVAESERDLPPVVAEQTAKALAHNEWLRQRSTLLSQRLDLLRQCKWWDDWNRMAELEPKPLYIENDSKLAEQTVAESERARVLTEDHAVQLQRLRETVAAETETREQLQSQLAELRSHTVVPAGGLGGFVKKLFGGTKTDPTQVALAAKLQELEHASETHRRQIVEIDEQFHIRQKQLIAEELSRIQSERTGRLRIWNGDCNKIKATRPNASRDELQMNLMELDTQLADSELAPVGPARDSMHRLGVVVGPLAALEFDPFFAPTHPEAEPAFDRILFADGEDLNEHDFTRSARLGNHWTMLGQVDLPRPAYRNGKPGRGEFFRETFEAVSMTPWRRDGSSLVAILSTCQNRPLRCETLADNSTIELRFHDLPDGDTELVEVAFPANVSLIEMKRFLLGELGQPKCEFVGLPEWSTTPECVVCAWPAVEQTEPFELGAGIHESLSNGITTQFRFELAADWTLETAQAWFAEQFGHLCASRTARFESAR